MEMIRGLGAPPPRGQRPTAHPVRYELATWIRKTRFGPGKASNLFRESEFGVPGCARERDYLSDVGEPRQVDERTF